MTEALVARARRNMIGDALRRAARVFREKPALHFDGRDWTFAFLDEAANRVGAALLAKGLRRGDRVVVYGSNSDAYLLTFLGCAKAGLIHVPANYALTHRELAYVVRHSGATMLLNDLALAGTADAAAEDAPVAHRGTLIGGEGFDMLRAALGEAGELPDEGADDDIVQIIYTSGTTGMPKGVALSHSALMAQYMSTVIGLEFTRNDRVLAALPLYHVAQMHAFSIPQLLAGAEQWLITAPDPATCLETIERHRINSFFAPPTVWITLLRHHSFGARDLRGLRNIYYGAAIMPVPVLQELLDRLPGARPFNCYGQSEIAPVATVLKPEEHAVRPASVGRPVINVETRVVAPDMNDVPPGQQGEIVHRSPQLLTCYWDNPEETAKAFYGGWFHSGDVGVADEEGYITIVDRLKDVINTGGVLVASREVEEALFTHDAVSEVAVIAVPDPKWVEAVAAVVVLRQGMTATAEELEAHARARLASYKVPKRIIFVDQLPKNTAGKLLKRELRAIYSGTASGVMGITVGTP